MSVMLYPCMLCVALLVLCVVCLTVFVNCLVKLTTSSFFESKTFCRSLFNLQKY